MSPVEIAQIQLDAEKAERARIAAGIRLVSLQGKHQGLSASVQTIMTMLADSIERGELGGGWNE